MSRSERESITLPQGAAHWVEAFATFNQAYAKTLTNNINSAVSARKADI